MTILLRVRSQLYYNYEWMTPIIGKEYSSEFMPVRSIADKSFKFISDIFSGLLHLEVGTNLIQIGLLRKGICFRM